MKMSHELSFTWPRCMNCSVFFFRLLVHTSISNSNARPGHRAPYNCRQAGGVPDRAACKMYVTEWSCHTRGCQCCGVPTPGSEAFRFSVEPPKDAEDWFGSLWHIRWTSTWTHKVVERTEPCRGHGSKGYLLVLRVVSLGNRERWDSLLGISLIKRK